MKLVFSILSLLLAVVAGQFYNFGDFGSPFSYRNFRPNTYSLNSGSLSQAGFGSSIRDPRANTGPVIFPPSPPGNPSDTSGVVAGASGFGFVAPQSQGVPNYFYSGFYFN